MVHDTELPQVENPEVFPRYVYMHQREEDDIYDSYNKRGGAFFESAREFGLRVEFVAIGSSWNYSFLPPWTIVFQPVPIQDMTPVLVPPAYGLTVILDVPFPITQPEKIQGTDEARKQVLDNLDIMFNNLSLACAVTTPHKEWAIGLTDKRIPAWYLPDINDKLSHRDIAAFAIKWSEIAATTMRKCASPTSSNIAKHLEH